eukprot:7226510-Pyramimonas_sp.AAC.1
MKELKESLLIAIKCLPTTTPVGLLTYGSSVSVYDLSQVGITTADVVSGTKPPSAAALRPLLYGSGAIPTNCKIPFAWAYVYHVLAPRRPPIQPTLLSKRSLRALGRGCRRRSHIRRTEVLQCQSETCQEIGAAACDEGEGICLAQGRTWHLCTCASPSWRWSCGRCGPTHALKCPGRTAHAAWDLPLRCDINLTSE